MLPLVVVENKRRWDLDIPGAQIISAREYLGDERFSEARDTHVFNLCRHYSYQSLGYYVSLLAEARGHRPLPSVATLQDLRLSPLLRIVSEELDELIQRSLAPLRSSRFTLSVYFGRNVAHRHDRLSQALFNQFPAPLLRADFVYSNEHWQLESMRPIAAAEIPASHRAFVRQRAADYFAKPRRVRLRQQRRYEMAILVDPDEEQPPSNERALQRFIRAAGKIGIEGTLVERDDYGRIAEYDALFIRQTTAVNHYTFRFSRRAAAEGLVVIDDPQSILRCANKVYLAELFARYRIPCPKTMIVDSNTGIHEVIHTVGLPCVVKQPDSSFSRGVVKATSAEELAARLESFLDDSELVVVQQYLPSAFDWRIGVLNGEPLFACKYHMATGHWQIRLVNHGGGASYGRVETFPVEQAPPAAIRLAVRATRPIGSGLYGVDIKQVGKRFAMIEVNDNPNIDAGYEDAVLGEQLYERIMQHFLARLEQRGRNGRSKAGQ